jgi:hypothetical protein
MLLSSSRALLLPIQRRLRHGCANLYRTLPCPRAFFRLRLGPSRLRRIPHCVVQKQKRNITSSAMHPGSTGRERRGRKAKQRLQRRSSSARTRCRLGGNDCPAGMRGVRTGVVASIDDGHDVAGIRFVHTGEASTGENSAGYASEDPHVTHLRLPTVAQGLASSWMCGSSSPGYSSLSVARS